MAVVGASTAVVAGRLPARPLSVRLVLHEFLIIVTGLVGYFGARGLSEGSVAESLDNAAQVVTFEKSLGIFVEPTLQGYVVDHSWAVTLANWVYIWGHWPMIFVVLGWLLTRHRETYYVIRNAMIISGCIGLVFFVLYPLAPPRLTDLAVVDTVTQRSNAYRVLQPPAFVNQYAAMPSLHFGWDLVIGIALFWNAANPLRWLGVVAPAAMFAAIVLTANHYIVDGIVGGAVALSGLVIALHWQQRHPDTRRLVRSTAPAPEMCS